MRLFLLIAVFALFTGWSSTITAAHGLGGLVTVLTTEPWARQVFVDLGISLVVAWAWLRVDAREKGIAAWPYVLATVAVGSIGVLAYLIHRELIVRRGAVQPAAS